MRILEKFTIRNFKSIREQTLTLDQLNVFIGGNGAGKSNLVQAFRLLREIQAQNLAAYSLERGADSLMYFGRKVSKSMDFELVFSETGLSNSYHVWLMPTDEGSLTIDQETIAFHNRTKFASPRETLINSGSRESRLATNTDGVSAYVRRDLSTYRVYHFHDTSDSAPVKSAGPIDDNRDLRSDASNLAAFLYMLQQRNPDNFRNIEDSIRQIAPFFGRFNLEPSRLTPDRIRLEWQENGSDAYFNAASLSDGTLRFMCLATLLQQPRLPAVILLDEPELGLHPAAIALLAGLLSAASMRTQVIVATQSVTLVNQFAPEHICIVDREDRQSVFKRLDQSELQVWLNEYGGHEGYGLGELWEKNLLGARP